MTCIGCSGGSFDNLLYMSVKEDPGADDAVLHSASGPSRSDLAATVAAETCWVMASLVWACVPGLHAIATVAIAVLNQAWRFMITPCVLPQSSRILAFPEARMTSSARRARYRPRRAGSRCAWGRGSRHRSWPVGASAVRTSGPRWSSSWSFPLLAPALPVTDAVSRLQSNHLHRLCAANSPVPCKDIQTACDMLRTCENLPNSNSRRACEGRQNVEQVHAIHSDRDGTGHRDGNADFQPAAGQPGGARQRHQPDRHAVPSPDQDDHRAAGVRHPGRRHRPYGLRRLARAHLRQAHGLVRERLIRLSAAWPVDGEPAAARRELPRHPPGQEPVDGLAGLGFLDREIPDPSDPDLDRGRDGAERDPADRGLRGVLLGRHGR